VIPKEMSNIVHINEAISLDGSQDNLTPEEYKSQLSSIAALETSDVYALREQNTNLIKLLENTHYMHEKNWTELLQLREQVGDLKLDLEDERNESNLLREKLFATSDNSAIDVSESHLVRHVSEVSKRDEQNKQLLARLLEAEKKYAHARTIWAENKEKLLHQIEALKADRSRAESAIGKERQSVSFAWKKVAQTLPEKSGIYLLTDGSRQCVGYFNANLEQFSSTTYFSVPSHWMERPKLPQDI